MRVIDLFGFLLPFLLSGFMIITLPAVADDAEWHAIVAAYTQANAAVDLATIEPRFSISPLLRQLNRLNLREKK